jgi:hypothetical protein
MVEAGQMYRSVRSCCLYLAIGHNPRVESILQIDTTVSSILSLFGHFSDINLIHSSLSIFF